MRPNRSEVQRHYEARIFEQLGGTHEHAVAGRYSGTGLVAMAGQWEVTVIVTRGDKEIGNKRFKVTAE